MAILAEDRPGFVKPMAEGLKRMVDGVGGEATIFSAGLDALQSVEPVPDGPGPRFRRTAKDALRSRLRPESFPALARRLRTFDAVVVVATIPRAFLRGFFADDAVRRLLRTTPLVLYDVFYLPTRGLWAEWLRHGNPDAGIPDGGHWGLDRYDWYLCASIVSECPPPPGPHPYSLVGLNLNDGTLYPEQRGEFLALLDFEHPQDIYERATQIQALERTGTPFLVLNGRYSTEEIRAIYRRTSVYFVAMRESFGLPICELQACGSYVFTPYSNWCPSHWKKPTLSQRGEGRLSPNFVVYGDDVARLSEEILRVRRSYDPNHVRETFLQEDSRYYWGEPAAVRDFLTMVQAGTIHARLHESHRQVPMPTYADVPDWPSPSRQPTFWKRSRSA